MDAYPSMESLIDFLSQHMASAERTPDQIRAYLQEMLPHLKHWQA